MIAMAATPTTTLPEEPPREPAQDSAIPEAPVATAAPADASEDPVGLERILLLLGVGAGTFGFGTIVFVGMLLLLVLVYFRARAHF